MNEVIGNRQFDSANKIFSDSKFDNSLKSEDSAHITTRSDYSSCEMVQKHLYTNACSMRIVH